MMACPVNPPWGALRGDLRLAGLHREPGFHRVRGSRSTLRLRALARGIARPAGARSRPGGPAQTKAPQAPHLRMVSWRGGRCQASCRPDCR